MPRLRPTNKLTVVLMVVIAVTCALVAAAVWRHFRHTAATPQAILEHLPKGANISIGKFSQTASRDGRSEWLLEAAAAHYIDRQKEVILENIDMTFFMQDGHKVNMTADKGFLQTDSRDITVSGNVVVSRQDVRLTTEKMKYHHDRRLLQTDNPVRIEPAAA